MALIHRRFPMVVIACCCAAGLAGCGEKSETKGTGPQAAQEASPAPGMREASQSAPTPSEAEVALPEVGQLPSDFPPDVPTYPGTTAQTGMSAPGSGVFAIFQTSAAPSEVYGFYREQMQENGWTLSEENEKTHRLVAKKGDRTAIITIMVTGPQTEIGVSIEGS